MITLIAATASGTTIAAVLTMAVQMFRKPAPASSVEA
jgi:hypothetical protein